MKLRLLMKKWLFRDAAKKQEEDLIEIDHRIDKFLESELKRTFLENTRKVMRHAIGSVDLNDLPKVELSESEQRNYNARVSSTFDIVEKAFKKLLRAQMEFMAGGGEIYSNDEKMQIVFGRGTVNGLSLLYEELREAHVKHIAASTPAEPVGDTHKLFPDLFPKVDEPQSQGGNNTSA